jgi:integrase
MSIRTPKYRLHKGSGQALVQIDGRRIYLGKHGTDQSKQRYRQLVAEWLRNGATLTTQLILADGLTIVGLVAAYLTFAESYYVKDGTVTDEVHGIRSALRRLEEMYGGSRVSDFRPSHLKNVRRWMIEQGLSRKYINDSVNRIRRMFKWGVENELVSPEVLHSLQAISGLKKGRSGAKEVPPVQPVPLDVLNTTLGQMCEVVSALVRFQYMTGCRPGEARMLRPCDVESHGDVWEYRPASHKSEHHDRERRIFVGPRTQAVLAPWLKRDPSNYCFRPDESATRFRGECFRRDSYYRAVAQACDRAGVESWSPNQLRHSRATELRARYGLDAAQTVLGHSSADVTQVYAERDFDMARRIMLEFG